MRSSPKQTARVGSPRQRHWGLVVLYVALVVYASLYPWTGWRDQGGNGWIVLLQPLPRYWSGFDVGINLAGYVPLGWLVAVSSRGRAPWWATFAVVSVIISLLSFGMETLQQFVPDRVPSMLDWCLNTMGGMVGAALAWMMHRAGWLDHMSRMRDQWLRDDAGLGLYLMIAWPAALLFPSSVVLGLGQVAERLHRYLLTNDVDESWADWLPELSMWDGVGLSPAAEVVVVTIGLWLPMMLAHSIIKGPARRWASVAAVAALGWAVCSLSAALSYGPTHAWVWWDTATQTGWLVAIALGLLTAPLPHRALWALSLVAGLCGLALVNQVPGNGYLVYNLVAWEQGQFVRFNGLAQWVGWLWPYIALAHVFFRLVRE